MGNLRHGVPLRCHYRKVKFGASVKTIIIFYLLFKARSQNYEKQLFASSCLSVCPCVRMEQLGYRTHFREILYFLGFFSKICRENSGFIEIRQA